MKQKDLTLIAVVVIFSAVFSLIISNFIFAPKKHRMSAPVVEKISADFPNAQSDAHYKAFFNPQAINPTVVIQVNDNNNPAPIGVSPTAR